MSDEPIHVEITPDALTKIEPGCTYAVVLRCRITQEMIDRMRREFERATDGAKLVVFGDV